MALITRACPQGCPVRWETDTPCPLCQAPGEGLPEDAKNPGGRPTRGGTPRRLKVVMTDAELGALKARAREEGTTVAELIRRIAPVGQ